jgi:hypothetical protein
MGRFSFSYELLNHIIFTFKITTIMNKIFTIGFLFFLAATSSLTAQVVTYRLNISGGNFMGSLIPDYTKWYYFSFEKGDTIGSSEAVLENVNPGQTGTEVINAEWKARTDWDIAFHATDIRTNSGESGDGIAGSLLPLFSEDDYLRLDEIFPNLAEAPEDDYVADEILTGSFIFGMTSMPPLRTAQLSASAAAAGWAAVAMDGNVEYPRILFFKTATGKYAKVYLKHFFDEEGVPGKIEFDYAYQPDGSRSFSTGTHAAPLPLQTSALSVSSSGGILQILSDGHIDATVYNLTGAVVKRLKGQDEVSIYGLPTGIYIVRATAGSEYLTQKVVVK